MKQRPYLPLDNSRALHRWARKELIKHGRDPTKLHEVHSLANDFLNKGDGFKDFTMEKMRSLLFEADQFRLTEDPAWYNNYIDLDWDEAGYDAVPTEMVAKTMHEPSKLSVDEVAGSMVPFLPSPTDVRRWQSKAPIGAQEYMNFHEYQMWRLHLRRQKRGLGPTVQHDKDYKLLQRWKEKQFAELKEFVTGVKAPVSQVVKDLATIKKNEKELNPKHMFKVLQRYLGAEETKMAEESEEEEKPEHPWIQEAKLFEKELEDPLQKRKKAEQRYKNQTDTTEEMKLEQQETQKLLRKKK